ncbi:hypothetical protein [uncultured Methanobrevibacter sp.]|uniref:hypothetical protein n=1 Tax=uncultured Methanobrevibacter sp. TaxID=253161 RepID=UPI00261F2E60|nr:hypothetical protein [uncultured Methanobrevibacter sp.]
MNSKYIIIIVAAVIVVAGAAGYFLFGNQLEFEHTTLVLSKSAYMESPVAENISAEPDKDGVYYYVDKENGVNITSCSNISIANSSKTIKKLKDDMESSSKKTYENNVVVYEKDGVYSIFVKNVEYNDTVIIQSLSKDLLLACWNTLKFHDPSDSLKFDNKTASGGSKVINAAEQTEEVVQTATATTSTSTASTSSSSDSSSSSDWGYDWSSSESSYSSSGGSSYSSGSVGGSASVDDFDFT